MKDADLMEFVFVLSPSLPRMYLTGMKPKIVNEITRIHFLNKNIQNCKPHRIKKSNAALLVSRPCLKVANYVKLWQNVACCHITAKLFLSDLKSMKWSIEDPLIFIHPMDRICKSMKVKNVSKYKVRFHSLCPVTKEHNV